MVAGDLTRENLRQAAKARKAAGEFVAKSRFDCVQPSDRTEMEEKNNCGRYYIGFAVIKLAV